MSEFRTGIPKLKVIKGKRRKFEPPADFDLSRAVEGGDRLLGALEAPALEKPVKRGTEKIPSLEEQARAKDLEKQLGSESSVDVTPENS